MRHKLFPFLIIAIGLSFVLGYFLVSCWTNEENEHILRESAPDQGADGRSANLMDNEPAPTSQPIFPTPTILSGESSLTVEQTRLSSQALTALAKESPCRFLNCSSRFGISGRPEMIGAAHQAGLPFGAYLTWFIQEQPPQLGNVDYWQMIGLRADGPLQSDDTIREVAQANPGSIWIVGNEPDVIWQDNLPPERYAELYYEMYHLVKAADPTAQIAIAGVAQPTKLRQAYLDRILDAYQVMFGEPMPVDIWTVHAFILREEAGSWGVGIPPGMEVQSGELYEISDHDDLSLFRQHIIDFRAWLADKGYADRPLAVTEFGILHPEDYGFPPETVAEFMVGAFQFFMTAANETGFPEDDKKLVQWWFWYSVHDGGDFPTGNLYDPEGRHLTPLGEVFAAYVRGEG